MRGGGDDLTPRSPHFDLQPVAEGVHVAIATDSGFGLCNSGIVDLGDAALVFDSMLTPQAGADLRRAAEELTGHPVAYVVNSHYHGDHVRGNSAFPSVHIVSTRKVRELIEERAVKMLESDRREVPAELEKLDRGGLVRAPRDRVVFEGWFRGILATPLGTVVPAPDLLVDGELLLRGPKREVHVRSFGGGHSPSDVLAFLPDDRVAFLGDLLAVGFHPGVTDGDLAKWREILDSVRRLGPERLLPGHGPLSGPSEIATLQEYLTTLQDLASAARRAGRTVEEIRATPIPEPFAGWSFGAFFPDNLLRAYEQSA